MNIFAFYLQSLFKWKRSELYTSLPIEGSLWEIFEVALKPKNNIDALVFKIIPDENNLLGNGNILFDDLSNLEIIKKEILD